MDCNLVFPFNLERSMEKFPPLPDSGCWGSLSRHLENVRFFARSSRRGAVDVANGNWS